MAMIEIKALPAGTFGAVSIFNFLTSAQIADVVNKAFTLDLSAAIAAALATHLPVVFPRGLYRIDSPIAIPKTGTTSIRGEGHNDAEIRAGKAMGAMVFRDTVANGSDLLPVSIENLFLNANRLANWGVQIGSGKAGKFYNIKVLTPLIGSFQFGNTNASSTAAFYENYLAHLIADGGISYQASSPPMYGAWFRQGATDNHVTMLVSSYLNTSTGVGLDNYGGGNIFASVHTYGAAYNVRSNIFCQITDPYTDTISVAGLQLNGDGIGVNGGEYYWPVGEPPAVGGAVPIEIGSGVGVVAIQGGVVRNDNGANPYIRCLGARPPRLTALGLTPARPAMIFSGGSPGAAVGDVANLLENSFGVRAGTGSVNAILEVEALASGRAQIQLKQNGIIRYTLGTDGTNATGSGDTNENLVLNVTRDDRSLYQLLKWFRATKTGYLIGSWCFGAAADRIGFYNANPVVKPTVTGAKGSNAALASLLHALAAQGLITNSTTP